MEALLLAIVATPGVVFLVLGLGWLAGWTPTERFVSRLTTLSFSLLTAGTAWLGGLMFTADTVSVRVSLGEWFRAGTYYFPLALHADRLSLPMVAAFTAGSFDLSAAGNWWA